MQIINEEKRDSSIDVLKAISVLTVAIFHYDSSVPQDLYLFVDLLFIITGYTTMLSISNKNFPSASSYGAYIINSRVCRLWVPYACIWILWVIYLIKHDVYTEFYSYINTLFLLQSIGFTDGGEIMGMNSIGIAWPLAAEFWTSILMFPIIYKFRQKKSKIVLSLSVILWLSFNSIYYQSQTGEHRFLGQLTCDYINVQGIYIPIALVRCIIGLCLGVIVYYLHENIQKTFIFNNKIRIDLTLGTFLLLFVIYTVYYRIDFRTRDTMVFPLVAAIFFLIFSLKKDLFSWILDRKCFLWFGKLYFGLFLMHPFAFTILNYLDIHNNLIYIILCIIFATLFHFTLEKFGMHLSKKGYFKKIISF